MCANQNSDSGFPGFKNMAIRFELPKAGSCASMHSMRYQKHTQTLENTKILAVTQAIALTQS